MPYRFNPLPSKFDRIQEGGVTPPIETLTGDSGAAVGPDGVFNIDFLGKPDIDVVGNPGTNTLQMTNLTKLSPYIVDATVGAAPYNTIQDAIDAANAAGGGAIYIRPGTYTENLTFYPNISLTATEGNVDTLHVKIVGTHTPPIANGPCTFRDLNFYGTTSIFFSAAAGEGYIAFETCNFILSAAGYIFDMDNWVGPTGLTTGNAAIGMTNSGDLSIAPSGFIKNTVGGCQVGVTNSYIGSYTGGGAGTPMKISGVFEFAISDIYCPIQVSGGNGSFIEQCDFHGVGFTANGTSSGVINNCSFDGLSDPAFVMDSSNDWKISTSTIDTTNNPAIDGTGTGTLDLAGISFMDNANIAGTITLSKKVLEAGIGYFDNFSFDQGTTTVNTDGQLIIGSTGNNPQINTLTAGVGITITNGPGSITIDAAGTANYTGQTIGAVTDDVATIPMGATPGVITFECRIAGFESGTPAGVGYQLFGTVRTNGVAASLVGIPDKVVNEDAALAAADADIVVSGNNAIVRVTGVAGVTINWVVHVENTSTI